MRRAWSRRLFVLTAVGTLACVEGIVSGGRPLSIELTATPTRAAVGDSVEFAAEASGTNLIILRLDFGDGVRDSLAAEGAVGATLKRKHAYDEEGAYLASAAVLDVSDSGLITVVDSVIVEVVPR